VHVRERDLPASNRLAYACSSRPQWETGRPRRPAAGDSSPDPTAGAPREPRVTYALIAYSKIVHPSPLRRVAERVHGFVVAKAGEGSGRPDSNHVLSAAATHSP